MYKGNQPQEQTQGTAHPYWGDVNKKEQEILDRVERSFLHQFDQQYGEAKDTAVQKAPQKVPFWQNSRIWGPLVACSVAAFVFVSTSTMQESSDPMELLHIKGTPVIQKAEDPSSVHKALDVTVPKGKSAEISEKKHWETKAASGTTFRVLRHSKTSSTIKLKKGLVNIHVHPNTMKHFVVRCHNGYKVHVKGTRFSVEQTKTWLRVEVTEGTVKLEVPGGMKKPVDQGQGLRVSFQSGVDPEPYPVKKGHQALSSTQKLSTLLEKGKTKALNQYARDLEGNQRIEQSKRAFLLENLAGRLYRKGNYKRAKHWFLRAHKLSGKNNSALGALSLAGAAKACFKALKAESKDCDRLYKRVKEPHHKDVVDIVRKQYLNRIKNK